MEYVRFHFALRTWSPPDSAWTQTVTGPDWIHHSQRGIYTGRRAVKSKEAADTGKR
jgi:hypothetical protein